MKCLNMHQEAEFDYATRLYLCRHEFIKDELKGPKVRDHDHITGDFLGAAHRQCNLERPVSFQISVFFHNFCLYDAHLIVHDFKTRPDREIKVIGQNMEKYLQVQWGDNMVFRYLLQFLPASFEQLIAQLSKTGLIIATGLVAIISSTYTKWLPICVPTATYRCLREKECSATTISIFFERLEEPALPHRKAFINKLWGEECSEADYTMPSTYGLNLTVKLSRIIWVSTCWPTTVY